MGVRGGGVKAAKLQPASTMISVEVIFSQRGINFLSQAAHSACGTAGPPECGVTVTVHLQNHESSVTGIYLYIIY